MMPFTIHTKPGCPHCDLAKGYLKALGLGYAEAVYDTQEAIDLFKQDHAHLANAEGKVTFPQVYKGTRHIGGADDLRAYFDAEEDAF